MNGTHAPYQLHGFDVSYFTAKVRSALRAKGVWIDERRANPSEIKRRTGLGFIPMVVTPDGETWQDSTEIYDLLEARHPDPPLIPGTPVQRMAAHLIELYTDEVALLPAMHYRWGIPEGERTTRMRFTAMIGREDIGKAAADRMAAARLLLGANEDSAASIEAHMRELLDALSAHLTEQPFLLGSRISIADCACMGPFYGHFFTDLPSRRLMLDTAWRVVGWIERSHSPSPADEGEWLADDALAPTLHAVLSAMGRDGAPLILDSAEALADWADGETRVGEPPRSVGSIESPWRGQRLTRMAQSYTTWMLQRVLDSYAGFTPGERSRVDAAFAGTGWEALLAYKQRHRLAKDGFTLVFE